MQAEINKWKTKSEKIRDKYKQVIEKSRIKQENNGDMREEL